MDSQNPTPPEIDPEEKHRAAVVAVLDFFNLPVDEFDRRRNDSLEKQIAAESPRLLKKLYLLLLEPGATMLQIQSRCPRWPAGHRHAGCIPDRTALRNIRARLIAAGKTSPEDKIEKRKLEVREKNTQLRETELGLEQKKLEHKVQSAAQPDPNTPLTDDPYDPIAEREKVRKMAERIYGINPHKNEQTRE